MRIELDTVEDPAGDGDTLEAFGARTAEATGATYAGVVVAHGPGGGHPIVAWEGDASQLRRVLLDAYGYDEDEARELYGV